MSMCGKGDETLPLGLYVPPVSGESDDGSKKQHQHDGYVCLPDTKGINNCGFSRPIATIMETVTVAASKKRSHSSISKDTECTNDHNVVVETNTDETIQQKRTITEERLHPEEALFLHMRGLLRIEYNNEAMSTQELFCKMLPECKISLAAYLAYAHLRAQGYILIRFSTERIKILMNLSLLQEANDCVNTSEGENSLGNKHAISEQNTDNNNNSNYNWRQAKQKLSDDVARASPPCVVSFDEWNDNRSKSLSTKLAYFAYNPNSNFKRSNPGLPAFGLAIMPFHSSGSSAPAFDTLSALVAVCESKQINGSDETDDTVASAPNEIPLRIATIADCGAVIVYGVTRGDVPVIAKKKTNS